jgi:hypothetical protein
MAAEKVEYSLFLLEAPRGVQGWEDSVSRPQGRWAPLSGQAFLQPAALAGTLTEALVDPEPS